MIYIYISTNIVPYMPTEKRYPGGLASRDRVTVNSVITLRRKQKILKLVEEGKYLSLSDFIRQAIRDKLEGGGA